ncbi:hypothetical protein T12_4833 [Trichinella patagoniensis]|uniref:Uncharacterized protein n=1 Tax=Trichinella patagoniensis TaxID=990121 RepID=A0A0V0Z1D9_9BILA|nr:hypothetical protein T12_4833 [Trichinella patagoniensis]
MGPAHAVGPEKSNNSRGIDAHICKLIQNGRDALIMVRQILLHHLRSALPPISPPRLQRNERPTNRNDAISGGEDQYISAGNDARTLPLHCILNFFQISEIPHAEAPVRLLLRQRLSCGVQKQGGVARLHSAVMEDVPEPGERCVLMALVEKLHLFPDNVLRLRAGLLVEIHHKIRGVLAIPNGREKKEGEENQS